MYDAVDDPYTYDGSTVLKNLLDLRTADELDAFEAEISMQRATEPLPDGDLDFVHYCAVHHHLFQDVYEWAGQPRTVRIAKGGSPFCFPENIVSQAEKLFGELKVDNFYQGLSQKDFAERSAHFLAELNAIHAFREGNGRSQLTFFDMLATHAGYHLNMDRLDAGRMLHAMIASFDGDEMPLRDLIVDLVA
ncbi:Fic/DOC family protein [Bradyrhizobium sp. 2TAF24]|uniref:Fic/DOC family protein n=1 Tax=Bradyrhizobium sp. 2TAF24 TaxID=3233011 RepID=UPI003F910FB2